MNKFHTEGSSALKQASFTQEAPKPEGRVIPSGVFEAKLKEKQTSATPIDQNPSPQTLPAVEGTSADSAIPLSEATAINTPATLEPVATGESTAAALEAAPVAADPEAELAAIADTFDATAAQAELDAILQGRDWATFESQLITAPVAPEISQRAYELKAQLEQHASREKRGEEVLDELLTDAGVSSALEAVPDANGNLTFIDKKTLQQQEPRTADFIILALALAWDISQGGNTLTKLTDIGLKHLMKKLGASDELISLFDTNNSSAIYQEMFTSMSQEGLDKKLENWSSEEITSFLSHIDKYDRQSLLAGKTVGSWPYAKTLSAETLKKLHNKLDDRQKVAIELTSLPIVPATPAA